MNKNLWLLSLLLLLSPLAWGQNEMSEINAIKRDTTYLYAMGTSSTGSEDASSNARDLIVLEIEQWLKENAVTDVAGYVAKSNESISQIKTKRGNLYRVFVFVKKTDILPYDKKEAVMLVSFADAQPQEEIAPKPVEEEAPQPIKEGTPAPYLPTDKEKTLSAIKDFNTLNEYINKGRQSGEITDVGNYKNLPSSGLAYVFIHNRNGEVPACLKLNDTDSVNLLTGMADSVKAYKGCGAIWIRLKQ